jgi:hypothetical protein
MIQLKRTFAIRSPADSLPGNPVPLIWQSILWAADEVEPLTAGAMDVAVNGRNLGDHVRLEDILPAVRARGGAAVVFGPAGVTERR